MPEDDDDRTLEEIIQGASQEDPDDQNRLAKRFGKKFYRSTIYPLLRGSCRAPRDHGEDISQSAWGRITQGLRRLRNPESFEAWGITTIGHLVLDHVRGPNGCKQQPGSIDELIENENLPRAAIYREDTQRESALLIDKVLVTAEDIHPKLRRILELRLMDFTFEEIAEAVEESYAAVRTIYYRGVAKLALRLGDKTPMAHPGTSKPATRSLNDAPSDVDGDQ